MLNLKSGFEELRQQVITGSRAHSSLFHGEHHWQLVALTGYELARQVKEVELELVFLFGLLHDCRRETDNYDPEHGPRGAEFTRQLYDQGELSFLRTDQLEKLCAAIYYHSEGETSADPTIAVCWDADRLNLWRVGVRPSPKLLSTEAAKKGERIEWARKLQSQNFSWLYILDKFQSVPHSPVSAIPKK